MLSFLLSLDLPSGAALAAAISALATFLAARFAPSFVWYVALGGPFLIAYSIYWGPSWLGGDASEYGSWEMLYLPPFYLAASISSLATVQIFRVLVRGLKELRQDDVSR
jgi:hypothetical protein